MQCLRMQEHQHAAVRLCCTAVQTYNITIGTAWQSVLTELGAQGMCSVELKLSYVLIAAIIVYAKQCTYYGQDQVLHCFALLWNNYNAMCVHNLPLLELHNFLFWVLEQDYAGLTIDVGSSTYALNDVSSRTKQYGTRKTLCYCIVEISLLSNTVELYHLKWHNFMLA